MPTFGLLDAVEARVRTVFGPVAILLGLAASVLPSTCYAQSVRAATTANEPRWVRTGTLSVARVGHTATLLPNGKVLVAGGRSSEAIHRSAELYDPATGRWTATGDMNTMRLEHQGTPLPNGKVLVVGGQTNLTVPNVAFEAELYDPDTGTWSYTSPPAAVRRDHTVTLLKNGRVLVAGGYSSPDSYYVPAAELYDPLTNTWSRAGRLITNRGLHQATLLNDGRVLVTGGYGPGGPEGQVLLSTTYGLHAQRLISAELFDPISGTWSPAADVPHARDWHTTTLLPNGQVLVAGVGNVAEAETASSFYEKLDRTSALYDPATGRWHHAAALKTGRGFHTATLLPSGDVLIAGGFDKPGSGDFGNAFPVAEIYDRHGNFWISTAPLSTARAGHTATLLPNGKVLVVGGTLSNFNGANWGATTELYESGATGVTIDAGFTGSWFDPAQSGHGFMLEVLPGDPMRLLAGWFTFAPQGGPSWIFGIGPIDGTRAVVQANQAVGSGGRFPPNFDAAAVRQESWGTLTFTFHDCDHGRVEWESTVAGYGSGGMDLTRLTLPAGLSCSMAGEGYWDY